MTPEPSVSMLVVRGLIHAAENAGASRADVLHGLNISSDLLDQADARVSQSEAFRIAQLTCELSGDPALGLRWTESLRERSFGSVTHMLAYSCSLRRGFELIAQFAPLLFDGPAAYVLIENARTFSVREGAWLAANARAQMFTTELLMSGILKLVRTYCASARPVRVAFRHAPPAHAAEYTRTFGPVVDFEQPHAEIEFDRALLDARSSYADPAMYEAQKTIAERRMLHVTQSAPYAVRVRELLSQRLPGRTSMAAMANNLGLSERSLRSALTAEGTSYRELEYTALGGFAKQLLEDPQRTIQETAYAMGFSDSTTFHRAFKRWTGMTPRSLRARFQASGSAARLRRS